jgi:hypothetical protein
VHLSQTRNQLGSEENLGMAWGGKTNLIEVVTQSHGTFVVAVRGYQRWKEKGLPWESISGKSATRNEAKQILPTLDGVDTI